MSDILRRALHTRIVTPGEEFSAPGGCSLVHGVSDERRSTVSQEVLDGIDEGVWEIREEEQYEFVAVGNGGDRAAVRTRSNRELDGVWEMIGGQQTTYLDITVLSHDVWAPLVRRGIIGGHSLRVVYVEPEKYRLSDVPTRTEIYDLSERIAGVRPLPGFVSFTPRGPAGPFVPQLGFEGSRLSYIMEQVEPQGGQIYPIVGAPGFLPEYPFHSFLANRNALKEGRAWLNVRFARANCPYSAYYLLEAIRGEVAEGPIIIAPIGPKPHALAAVVFYLRHPDEVELVYDHPIRQADRTRGWRRLLVFPLEPLLERDFGELGA